MVALVERQGADAVGADVAQGGLGHALDGAEAGDEEEELVLLQPAGADHRADFLAALGLDDVDDVAAAGVASGLGDVVALLDEDAAQIGEEEDVVVCGGGEHGLHVVLLLGGHGAHALAAAALGAVFLHRQALDVAAVGQGKDALLLLDEVLDVDLVGHVLDLGLAAVAVPVAQGEQLVLEHALDLFGVREQVLEIGDPLLKLLVLVFELFPVEALQRDQAHIADGLRLHVVQAEALHQVLLGVVVA